MTKEITLHEFIRLGGALSNFPLTDAKTTYSDKNYTKKLEGIKTAGFNNSGTTLYTVFFTDGSNHRYAGSWIVSKVEFVLNAKYF